MAKIEPIIVELPLLPFQSPCGIESLMPWLVKSRSEVGELKGYSSVFSRSPELIHSFFLLDAVDTLALDGILSSKESALESQLLNDSEQSVENRQSLRFRSALLWGKNQLDRQPINEFLIKSIQSHLTAKETDSFRSKNVGQIKNGSPFSVNQFPAAEQIKPLIENLLSFIQLEDPDMDPLVRAIMASAQFEAIRPFDEGAVKLSRILMQLLLKQSGLLSEPLLLLSSHIRKNPEAYSKLYQQAVFQKNWCPYIKFMLHGISLQAKESREKLSGIDTLYHRSQEDIKKKCAQIYTRELVDAIFHLPIISPLRLSSKLDIHYTTATRYLKKLDSEGFLENRQSGKYQLYSNKPLIQLLNQ